MKQFDEIREIMREFKDWIENEGLEYDEAYLGFEIEFMGRPVSMGVEFEDEDLRDVVVCGDYLEDIITDETRRCFDADSEVYRMPLEKFIREFNKSGRVCTIKSYEMYT